jgi:Zn-dependent M16 (insulinase) family peptidase
MFTLINESRVDAFGILAREYHHGPSGARLVHLKSERELHAFQVCFRTLPQDDSGVAHILEHSVLEGSRRFPQPGIFHKRAADLLGACNAMTGKDTTYYPFHSSDRKDFLQMLEIYLDSVFFPLLDRETFLQEGHHPEWKDPQDPAQGLGVVGVVYNEMKGGLFPAGQAVLPRLAKGLPRGDRVRAGLRRGPPGDPRAVLRVLP